MVPSASMLAPVRDIATISKMSPNLYVRKIEERNIKLQSYVKHLEAKLDQVALNPLQCYYT
jgi:hypothetical protein